MVTHTNVWKAINYNKEMSGRLSDYKTMITRKLKGAVRWGNSLPVN
jgi:hypothetical protein